MENAEITPELQHCYGTGHHHERSPTGTQSARKPHLYLIHITTLEGSSKGARLQQFALL